MKRAGASDLTTYTLARRDDLDLYVIEGRWPDGSIVVDGEGEANWAFSKVEEASEFWKALIVVHEQRGDQRARFVDRVGV